MKKNTTIIIVLIIVLLIIGLVFAFFGSDEPDLKPAPTPTPSQNVTLEATTDKASYKTGEEVNISFSLVNAGETALCLGEGALGNISFTSLTKDGEATETRSAASDFLASLTEILNSRLKPVAPGETMEFNLTSTFDPGLKANALDTTRMDEASDMTTFYNVEEPGTYEIELVYEYLAGPTDLCKDIYRGKTNKVIVTFNVE